jgi:hypothetical protein
MSRARLLAILGEFVAEETDEIAMVGEDVRLVRSAARRLCAVSVCATEPRIGLVVHVVLHWRGGLAMDTRDESADGSSRVCWNHLRRFDFDAMNRAFGRRSGVIVRPVAFATAIALAILLRRVFERELRGFRFARSFESLPRNRIDVKTPLDEWHRTSKLDG